jgi:hypothetical protein
MSADRHLDEKTRYGLKMLVENTNLPAPEIAAAARTSERTVYTYMERYRTTVSCGNVIKADPGPDALIRHVYELNEASSSEGFARFHLR